MFYSKKGLLGTEYIGKFITMENINTLITRGAYENLNIAGAKDGGIRKYYDEWLRLADGKDVFIYQGASVGKWTDIFYENRKENVTYYIAQTLGMKDENPVDGESFSIVFIDGKIELRRSLPYTTYVAKDRIDFSTEVTDPQIIQKMENTMETALKFLDRLAELRAQEALLKKEEGKLKEEELKKLVSKVEKIYAVFGVEKTKPLLNKYYKENQMDGDILAPLCEKDWAAYIDWKWEFEDTAHDINRLLKKKGLPPIETDPNIAAAFNNVEAEIIAKHIISQFANEDFCFVMVDTGTDGFYLGLIREDDFTALHEGLADFGYKLERVFTAADMKR